MGACIHTHTPHCFKTQCGHVQQRGDIPFFGILTQFVSLPFSIQNQFYKRAQHQCTRFYSYWVRMGNVAGHGLLGVTVQLVMVTGFVFSIYVLWLDCSTYSSLAYGAYQLVSPRWSVCATPVLVAIIGGRVFHLCWPRYCLRVAGPVL
jgi:hypothetical protein